MHGDTTQLQNVIVLLTFAVVLIIPLFWSNVVVLVQPMVTNWSLSWSPALDIKVIHPLNNSNISDAGQTSGASAAVSEQEKLDNNALGCLERS